MDDDQIRARIQALLSKTVENGCTEEEALAAASKAAELIGRYGVEPGLDGGFERRTTSKFVNLNLGNQRHEVRYAAHGIAFFSDCKWWNSWAMGVEYFGFHHDVELAIYLTDMFRTVMERQWRIYYEQNRGTGHWKTLRASFMRGMAARLSDRLIEMKLPPQAKWWQYWKARKIRRVQELTISKWAVIEDEFERFGPTLTDGKADEYDVDSGAYLAGTDAGDRPSIARGIGQGEEAGTFRPPLLPPPNAALPPPR